MDYRGMTQTEYTKQQIHETVVSVVARSLACEPDEITAGVSLVDELGMDSLDFLDVIFTLEKNFKVKLLGNEINKLLRPDRSQANEQLDSHLSLEEMNNLAPFITALQPIIANNGKIVRADLFKLVTTETLVALVSNEIENKTSLG